MGDIGKKIFEEYGTETAIFIIISFFIITYILKQVIPMWINTAIKEEETKNNKEIEKLKSELDKQKQQLEHMHQVSQVTYQKLFKKKIEIYLELINIKLEHNKILIYSNIETEDDYYDNIDLYIDELNDVEKIIDPNELFISNELLEVYEKLKEKKETLNFKFKDLALAHYNNPIDDISYEEETQKIKQIIYEETKKEFSNFHNILANDIQKIKIKINLD